MIICHYSKSVIATPTKTGALSLKNWATRLERQHGSDYITTDRHKHRMTIPDGLEDYRRMLLVRNPYDRLVSMYFYIREKHWEWEHDRVSRQSWRQFLEYLLDVRPGDLTDHKRNLGVRPVMWTASMSQMLDFLASNGYTEEPATVDFIHIESADEDMEMLGVHSGDGVRHNHKTASRNSTLDEMWEQSDYDTRFIWHELCGVDADRFGY